MNQVIREPRPGRPPLPEEDRLPRRAIRLSDEDWAWLMRVSPDGKRSTAIRRLIERAKQFPAVIEPNREHRV